MRTLCGTILAAAMAALSAHGAFDVRDFGAKGDGTTMKLDGDKTPRNARFTELSAISTL